MNVFKIKWQIVTEIEKIHSKKKNLRNNESVNSRKY